MYGLWPRKFSSRLFLMTLAAGLVPILIFAALVQKYYREFRPEIRQAIQQAYDEQWSHNEVLLRETVGTLIEQKASDVALQIALTLEGHPYMTLEDLQRDKAFRKIAVQPFGRTGYTALHETNTGIIRFHKLTRLQNRPARTFKRDYPALWAIMRKGYGGKSASGYYGWRESDGEMKQKYICIVPIRQPTADGVYLSVGVTATVDEFTNPIKDAEAVHRKTAEHLGATSEKLFQSFRRLGLLSMGFGIVIISFIAFGVGIYFSRAITRLRKATQKVVEGDFSVSVKPSMSGEVRTLTEDFNRMVRQLSDTTVSKRLLEASEQRLVESNRELQHEIVVRIAAERTLSTEKERLAVTLRSIRDGVITTDRQGNIVLINRAAETLTGWPQAEAGGRGLGEIFRSIDERTKVPSENPVDATIRRGDALGLETTRILISRDGSERIIALSGAPIRDDNTILGVVIVFRDITRQRKMEEQLLKLRKLESVSTLAGGVAHDFNNLLAVILGNISFAKTLVGPADKVHKRLTEAENATLKGKDLIYRLLAYSREGDSIKKVMPLKEIIEESTDLALSGSQAKAVLLIAEDLCRAEVHKDQIGEVIRTIVTNAGEATPEGGTITVRAENIKLGAYDAVPLPEGNYIRVSIEDQGGGIPEEDLPRIFDPYFTTKEMGNVKGTGLGLAISHSIISNHDGLIAAHSEKGAGTTFQIYLPACT
jgi:PAS domain S-box-containing protein